MTPANDYRAQAKAYLDQGDYDRVIALCTETIRLDSSAVWAFLCRGVAHDFKAGRFWFGDALSVAFLRTRMPQYSKGGPDSAIADFTEAIRLDPSNPAGYSNRGNNYLATGRHPQAIADYTEAIRLDPSNPVRYVARAYAYQGVDWDRAVADFNEAIRLDRNEPNHHVGRVNAFGKEGRWKQILDELSEAIRADPTNALAYALRATAHNGMGRFDRSIPDATEAIRLDPQLFLGFSARGYGYLQRGNPQPGARTSTSCLAFLVVVALGAVPGLLVGYLVARMIGDPGVVPTLPITLAIPSGLIGWFFLGFLPALAGQKRDLRQCVADFTQALELRPNDVGSYMGRALAYRARGEADSAARDELRMRTTAGSSRPDV